jgi:hypothetical protein
MSNMQDTIRRREALGQDTIEARRAVVEEAAEVARTRPRQDQQWRTYSQEPSRRTQLVVSAFDNLQLSDYTIPALPIPPTHITTTRTINYGPTPTIDLQRRAQLALGLLEQQQGRHNFYSSNDPFDDFNSDD